MKNNLKLTELCKKEMSRIIGGKPAHCGCGCLCTCQEGYVYSDMQTYNQVDVQLAAQGSIAPKDSKD